MEKNLAQKNHVLLTSKSLYFRFCKEQSSFSLFIIKCATIVTFKQYIGHTIWTNSGSFEAIIRDLYICEHWLETGWFEISLGEQFIFMFKNVVRRLSKQVLSSKLNGLLKQWNFHHSVGKSNCHHLNRKNHNVNVITTERSAVKKYSKLSEARKWQMKPELLGNCLASSENLGVVWHKREASRRGIKTKDWTAEKSPNHCWWLFRGSMKNLLNKAFFWRLLVCWTM